MRVERCDRSRRTCLGGYTSDAERGVRDVAFDFVKLDQIVAAVGLLHDPPAALLALALVGRVGVAFLPEVVKDAFILQRPDERAVVFVRDGFIEARAGLAAVVRRVGLVAGIFDEDEVVRQGAAPLDVELVGRAALVIVRLFGRSPGLDRFLIRERDFLS